ncbi:hypothetical protein [Staphylococcus aureus]|nr:hypothetical protein [Staphylococcus aureus]
MATNVTPEWVSYLLKEADVNFIWLWRGRNNTMFSVAIVLLF